MTFSNGGLDTFETTKQFIGVRMQEGVPVLDRDWNEMEDVRRYFERMLRQHFIGDGIPDVSGFAISAPTFATSNDVLIGVGRCMVDGFDVANHDEVLFSEQGDRAELPDTAPDRDDTIALYLEPDIVRVDADSDPDLRNTQDINIETCVRDRLVWAVRAAREPALPPAGSVLLAIVSRPAGSRRITDEMITDRRRVLLNLADTVDRVGRCEERLGVLESAMEQAQLELDAMKEQLGRLFWDVSVATTGRNALFGGKVTLTATVTDRLGTPIRGSVLSFSTDWGSLSSTFATTNAQGVASVDLVGVQTETPLRPADIGLLDRIGKKVDAVTLSNPGAVEYARLKFEPDELSIVSRYSPAGTFVDLSNDLPTGPIVARPQRRTATVTVYAQEGQGAIVRGVGSMQVHFGLWVRDFVRTKIADITRTVAVGARIGSILREGMGVDAFDENLVVNRLPTTLQSIQDDTNLALKQQLFTDPGLDSDQVSGLGMLGQVIAQEATSAIGGQTNQAIVSQISQFVATDDLPIDAAKGREATTAIVQKSSQIAAGFAQDQRQLFGGGRIGV